MSTNFHTPIIAGESNSPATINTRLATLDAAIAGESGTLSDRIDDLIIDAGTSDAETIAARTTIRYGTAPATLGAALAIVAARTLYVDAFGAVGDGVTNDATALASVFTAAQPGDTIVFTPGKTYKCNSGLTCADAGVTITGYGAALDTSSYNDIALRITATEVSVLGLTFIGDTTTGSSEEPIGEEDMGIESIGTYTRVIDCHFEGYYWGGVRVLAARGVVRGCTFVGVRNYDADHYGAIHIGQTSHAIVIDNHFTEVMDAAISVYRSSYCTIANNTIVCSTASGAAGSMGIYANAEIVGCSFSGNVITGSWNEGIMLGNGLVNSTSYGNSITGNTIANCKFTGITVRAAVGASGQLSTNRNNTVSGNTISITTLSGASPAPYGIFLDGAAAFDVVSDITVSGNAIHATKDGASFRLTRGIVADGSGCARLTYSGNSVSGASVGIYLTGTYTNATGNMVHNCSTGINVAASAYGLAIGNTVTECTLSIVYGAANTLPVAARNYLNVPPSSPPLTWSQNEIVDISSTGSAVLVAGEANIVSAAFASTVGSALVDLARLTPGGTPGALYVSDIVQAENRIIVKSTSATDTSTIIWRLLR